MIELDGSYGEGGGQIVRTALGFSTVRHRAFEISNIRKGRSNPGLKAQHMNCIKALEHICNAKSEGALLGSTDLKYYPGILNGGNFEIDIGTAGSVALLLQAVLLPACFAKKNTKITVTGGTCAKWAPSFDYFNSIFIPQFSRFCEKVQVNLIKRGYYPKGGGKVEVRVVPKYKLSEFPTFEKLCEKISSEVKLDLIERGKLVQIKGVSHASMDLESGRVAERQAHSAQCALAKYRCPVNIRTEYVNSLSTGSGITLWAIFSKEKDFVNIDDPIRIGADALGERGKGAEDVGCEAAGKLIEELDSYAAVDSCLADQILPFMALVKGACMKVSKITEHTRTNMYVIEKFMDKIFEVDSERKVIGVK